MKEIADDPDLQLQVIATGMHLSPEFGLTYQQIEVDGFEIDAKLKMLLSYDKHPRGNVYLLPNLETLIQSAIQQKRISKDFCMAAYFSRNC